MEEEIEEKIEVGDIVNFNLLGLIENLDLAEWLANSNNTQYKVIEVDEESRLFYIENCEYGISFDEKFRKENN